MMASAVEIPTHQQGTLVTMGMVMDANTGMEKISLSMGFMARSSRYALIQACVF